MTDNEIMKVLELCFLDTIDDCNGCPLKSKKDNIFSCIKEKQLLTIDLIKRQKAEISVLSVKLADSQVEISHLKKTLEWTKQHTKEMIEFVLNTFAKRVENSIVNLLESKSLTKKEIIFHCLNCVGHELKEMVGDE